MEGGGVQGPRDHACACAVRQVSGGDGVRPPSSQLHWPDPENYPGMSAHPMRGTEREKGVYNPITGRRGTSKGDNVALSI